MKRATRAHRGCRGGQVLVLFAFALVGLALGAAFAIDLGSLVVSRARLRNASDAASLAALTELWQQRAAGASESEAREAALAEAQAIVQLNYAEAGAQVTFGVWDGEQFTTAGPDVPANGVTVTAMRNASAPGGPDSTAFAGMFGVPAFSHAAQGVARFHRNNLIPFAVHEDDVGSPGDIIVMYDDNTVVPGVFGLLDFDGGSNGANDVAEWIRYGYQGPLFIDPAVGHLIVEGTPGLKASIRDAVSYHIEAADPVTMCVYRSVTGHGAGARFDLVGFVGAVITEQKWQGQDKYIKGRVLSKYIVGSGATDGPMRDVMALQLVD